MSSRAPKSSLSSRLGGLWGACTRRRWQRSECCERKRTGFASRCSGKSDCVRGTPAVPAKPVAHLRRGRRNLNPALTGSAGSGRRAGRGVCRFLPVDCGSGRRPVRPAHAGGSSGSVEPRLRSPACSPGSTRAGVRTWACGGLGRVSCPRARFSRRHPGRQD